MNWFTIKQINRLWYIAGFMYQTNDWKGFLAGFKACLKSTKDRWDSIMHVWKIEHDELLEVRDWVNSQNFHVVLWCEPDISSMVYDFVNGVKRWRDSSSNDNLSSNDKSGDKTRRLIQSGDW